MALQRALIPTDLSEYSLSLQSCVDMYRLMGVQWAQLFHVQEKPSPPAGLVRKRMEAMAVAFQGAGMEASIAMAEGEDAAVAILEKAGEVRPDLIIMGSHGKGALKRLLLGSVSHKVVAHWPGSILIERLPLEERGTGALEEVCQRRVSHVVLASRRHLQQSIGGMLLERLAKSGLQRAHLFTALELNDFVKLYVLDQIPEMRAQATRTLEDAAAPLRARGLEVDVQVEVGTLVPSLSKLAAASQADLAIVELQGPDDPWCDLVERLVTRLPCSVLIIRPKVLRI